MSKALKKLSMSSATPSTVARHVPAPSASVPETASAVAVNTTTSIIPPRPLGVLVNLAP